MIEARHRRGDQRARTGGMFQPGGAPLDPVLLDPQAQPIIARLGAAICHDGSTIDTRDHLLRVAAVALRAKRNPFNAYARATL